MISNNKPKIRRQKSDDRPDRAYVVWHDQRIYLGRWGSPEAHAKYERLIAESRSAQAAPIIGTDITVAELAVRFLQRCETHYRRPDDRPTAEIGNIRIALRPVTRLYGDTLASAFGPKALKACRTELMEHGGSKDGKTVKQVSRQYVNKHVNRIRMMFKWGVEEELVSPVMLQALQAVAGLKKGRCKAVDHEPVRPVPQTDIDAIARYVSSQVWALVQLMILTAARAGELIMLRPVDIDTSGRVWVARLDHHKTAHHGKERHIYIGPRGQRIVREFLNRPVDAYLFSPIEAKRERYSDAHVHRRPNQKPNPRKTARTVGDHYTTGSYRRAIHLGCELAGIPVWGPHRLRHNAATEIRKEHGLEAAQVMLGHANADITQVYAEIHHARGVEIASAVG